MGKLEELEGKIRRVAEELHALRRANRQLRSECESLKSHVTLLSSENAKAQRVLAEHQDLRRRQEQATQRLERALNTLNTLRPAS